MVLWSFIMNTKRLFHYFIYPSTALLICSAILLSNLYLGKGAEKPCFVLLTDFGYDFAVGCMKGAILSQLPEATIVDLDHSVQKFNVLSGSFVLSKSYKYFPMRHYIHLCR
jgi:S-adenosyl-l-methionine hydroxide adenosyltransferase